MATLAPSPRASFEQLAARWWRPVLVAVALACGLAARLTYHRDMPLWFDETFTGVIASQASVGGLWHWLQTEVTGPFFYGLYWLWARVAGVSTEALRLPGLLFTLAAPLLVLACGNRDATMRTIWAAVLLLWLPMAVFAGDARPYALLLLLGTLQAAAFCALMREPTRRRALWWVLPTLAIGLTHYIALLPGLLQGLILLSVHRGAAIRLWPAALPFALLATWMTLHLPFLARVAGGNAAMTTTMGWETVLQLPPMIVGDERFALLLTLPLGWMLVEQLRQREVRGWPSPEAWTGIAGVGALVALVVIAMAAPGIAIRYFIPMLPAVLFGLAWWLRQAIARGSVAPAAFFAAAIVASIGLTVSSLADRALDQRHAFGTDLASRWLAERPPARILFFWADPTADLAPDLDRNLAEFGGFFLRRAGHQVMVEVIHVPQSADAAAVVAERAARTGAAILWVANAPNAASPRDTAPLFRDPRLVCRDFGAGLSTSVACRLSEAVARP